LFVERPPMFFAKSVDGFSALWQSLNAKGANEANLHEKIKNSRFFVLFAVFALKIF